MRTLSLILGLALMALSSATLNAADDSVTISKSRLEELERKAAELERLKATNPPTPPATATKPLPAPMPGTAAPAPVIAAPPKPAPTPVPGTPLKATEIISSEELADHFLSDPNAANARYRGKKITVRGQIVAFDKPLFIRNYKVLLQTSERAVRVICDVYPPSEYQSVYTTKEGVELVALLNDRARTTLARVGDVVTIRGECKGFKDGAVRLSGCSY